MSVRDRTRRRRTGAKARATSAAVFGALSDDTRLSIVTRLCRGGPQSIASLAGGAPVTRQAITKHLRVMEAAGLATSRRRGRERIWSLQPDALEQAHRYLDEISSRWDAALERLRLHVAEGE